MEAGAERLSAEWERNDGRAGRSRQDGKGVQEKWRRSQTNRKSRRGRRRLVRRQTTRKNAGRQAVTEGSEGDELRRRRRGLGKN